MTQYLRGIQGNRQRQGAMLPWSGLRQLPDIRRIYARQLHKWSPSNQDGAVVVGLAYKSLRPMETKKRCRSKDAAVKHGKYVLRYRRKPQSSLQLLALSELFAFARLQVERSGNEVESYARQARRNVVLAAKFFVTGEFLRILPWLS